MKRLALHHWILIAMLAGALIGLPLNWAAEQGLVQTELVRKVAGVGKAFGDLFLRLLQMLVVPLIVSSLISGIAKMGDLRKLGTIGIRTLGFYLTTSMLAILTGVAMVNLIKPGVGANLGLLEADATASVAVGNPDRGVGDILWQQLQHMIPKNPLGAAAAGDMLPIIFFSLLLAVFINASVHSDEESNAPILQQFFDGLFDVMMRMTLAVIRLAPIGVFGFMLYAAAGKGLSAFQALGWYVVTVAAALGVHAFVTLPILLRLWAGRSAPQYARSLAPALVTAFSTASSNGTLPLTMHSAESAGVKPRVTAFVLPLGATINMDGTALYEAVAVLFIAQVYGMDLSLAQQGVVALTALLASVGAAGIPHAGTVMMVVVLGAVGLPTTAVGLILAVDRILDMCRTTVNVWSDSIAAAVIDKHA